MVSFNSVLSTCRQAASQFVNPISPSIVSEFWWSATAAGESEQVEQQAEISQTPLGFLNNPLKARVESLASTILLGVMGMNLVSQYQKTSLPKYPITYPFYAAIALSQTTFIKQYKVGAVIAKNMNKFLEGAHLALITFDIYAGNRVSGTTRLLAWAYYITPAESLPAIVNRVASIVAKVAIVIFLTLWCYNRPYLSASIAGTVTATAILIKVGSGRLKQFEDTLPEDKQDLKEICRDLRTDALRTLYKIVIGTYKPMQNLCQDGSDSESSETEN